MKSTPNEANEQQTLRRPASADNEATYYLQLFSTCSSPSNPYLNLIRSHSLSATTTQEMSITSLH
ncbi:unnamed protein product [Clavelina lepadiformis]|uniref:Uncharacterized protein n=1 Tax=Clavelina lepadiformis TaxID=159417 RepID=A0ABP0EYD5_CLALP